MFGASAAHRKLMEDLLFQEVDATIIPVDVAGIASEWVMADGASADRRLLYLHGGAFRFGSPRSHRYITAELSRRAGAAVLAIDYRMLPEYKVIDCHEDARTAYRWILEHGPDGDGAPDQFFVAGDSAGGTLTLSVIAWARDTDLPGANGAVAFSPVTDYAFSSPTYKTNIETDPFLGPELRPFVKIPRTLALFTRYSSGGRVNRSPISPLLGDLSNLPPTLIQVSRDEMLFGDAVRYANKAAAAGSSVELQVWPKLVHVFQAFGPDLPEATEALELAAEFIRAQVKSNSPNGDN
nr:lipolytic enzyme [uncultured bacterium]